MPRLAFTLAEERYNEVRDVLLELKEMEEEQAVRRALESLQFILDWCPPLKMRLVE